MEGKRKLKKGRGPFPWQKFLQDESGATATEYAVMLTVIMLCVISIAGLGTFVNGLFTTASLGW